MKNFVRFQAFLICMMLTKMFSAAQSSQMATLLHDGTITNYYSSTAFIEALDAAVDGDVISLSSGSFVAKSIFKNVSIRGVGYTVQGYNENENPTILTGDFELNNPKSETNQLTLEGIINNGQMSIMTSSSGFTALKCQFKKILSFVTSKHREVRFIHCVIDNVSASDSDDKTTMSFLNSVIKNTEDLRDQANVQYTNSVVEAGQSVSNSNILNSIVTLNDNPNTYGGTTLQGTCHVTNSIIIGCEKSYATGSGNKHLPKDTQVFSDGSFYRLNDEYKQMKGVDGTEIGIHGGNMPFTPVTSRPRITKFNVAAKTTADGKLSVDIEVKGEE